MRTLTEALETKSQFLPRVLLTGAFVFGVVACTTTSGTAAAPPAPAPAEETPVEDSGVEEPAAPVADACGALKVKSKCKPANEGSIVRGVVKFDPSKLKGSAKKTKLRVFLHHQIIAMDEEAKLGGHPHAFDSYDVDMEKGEARFALDMCELGTAMWSEENCGFNIVVMLDDDGENDPDANGTTALIPRVGKPTKMVPVEVSCHKTSQCLEIDADCLDGDGCTTFEPATSCSCAADKCQSDDKLCER